MLVRKDYCTVYEATELCLLVASWLFLFCWRSCDKSDSSHVASVKKTQVVDSDHLLILLLNLRVWVFNWRNRWTLQTCPFRHGTSCSGASRLNSSVFNKLILKDLAISWTSCRYLWNWRLGEQEIFEARFLNCVADGKFISDFWFWGFCTVCKINSPPTSREPLWFPKRRRKVYLAHRAKTPKPKISIHSTVKV
jgi:hypothetical protein